MLHLDDVVSDGEKSNVRHAGNEARTIHGRQQEYDDP